MSEATSIYVTYAVCAVVWYVLQVIGYRGIFKKAGVSQSKAFIPFLREVEMFNLSWNKKNIGMIWLCVTLVGLIGLYVGSMIRLQVLAWIGAIALVCSVVLSIIRATKASKAFQGTGGTTAGLILVNPIFNIVLARNKDEYKGAQN